jgi:Flp pilus assembly protein TadG
MQARLLRIADSEQGASLVETAVMVPFLMLILLAVVDFGRIYYLANEVEGAAQAGAVYGAQDITDTTGMTNVAKDNAPDVSGLSVTSSYGCECSDGTHSSASCTTPPTTCSVNMVYYATVATSVSYTPLFPWVWRWNGAGAIPSPITISRSATMRSATE